MNVLALIWGAGMLVNFLWFTSSPLSLRTLTNPKANQTAYLGPERGPLVNLHFGFLNKIPLIELIMLTVIVVGAIYYYAVQAKKPFTPVVSPEEEVLPEGVGA